MANNKPYQSFGEVLKKLRAQHFKTPAEVSSAVEIDEQRLRAFENGEQRPSEDVLLLLIQHYNLSDKQADELWRLAGYNGQPEAENYAMHDDFGSVPQVSFSFMQPDTRIVYTDMVQVMINNYGVIMNFMQGAGTGPQPLAVARVGMSKEHARSVIEILQKTLDQAEASQQPKKLQSPQLKVNKSPKNN